MFIQQIKAIILLARPVNVLIAMLSVWIGGIIAGVGEGQIPLLMAMLSAGSIAAASNSINDYFDIEIDRINKPERPLASNTISAETGWNAALMEYGLGVAISSFISSEAMSIALFFSLLTFVYASRLKGTVIWGNLTVSASSAAAFVYGGVAVNNVTKGFYPALFALLFHFGREIVKDMADIEGDSAAGAQTLPIMHGHYTATRVVWITFILLIAVTILPYASGLYNGTYMLMVSLGIYPVLLYVLNNLHATTEATALNRFSNLLKADMLVGLLAIYVG